MTHVDVRHVGLLTLFLLSLVQAALKNQSAKFKREVEGEDSRKITTIQPHNGFPVAQLTDQCCACAALNRDKNQVRHLPQQQRPSSALRNTFTLADQTMYNFLCENKRNSAFQPLQVHRPTKVGLD